MRRNRVAVTIAMNMVTANLQPVLASQLSSSGVQGIWYKLLEAKLDTLTWILSACQPNIEIDDGRLGVHYLNPYRNMLRDTRTFSRCMCTRSC